MYPPVMETPKFRRTWLSLDIVHGIAFLTESISKCWQVLAGAPKNSRLAWRALHCTWLLKHAFHLVGQSRGIHRFFWIKHAGFPRHFQSLTDIRCMYCIVYYTTLLALILEFLMWIRESDPHLQQGAAFGRRFGNTGWQPTKLEAASTLWSWQLS